MSDDSSIYPQYIRGEDGEWRIVHNPPGGKDFESWNQELGEDVRDK